MIIIDKNTDDIIIMMVLVILIIIIILKIITLKYWIKTTLTLRKFDDMNLT